MLILNIFKVRQKRSNNELSGKITCIHLNESKLSYSFNYQVLASPCWKLYGKKTANYS